MIRDHSSIRGLAVVLMVAAIGISLTLQGWRSRVPAFDLVPHIYNTRDLLASGAIPVHGDTGSYGSYKPPGTAWLMAPSALLFADPRLSEYAGTGLLHLAALLGLFLLTRAYFGPWCAGLAVLLYGLSEHGLFLAGSLWPNGRPDFYVWIVYLASRWVARKNARYLAASLTLWAVGMYVDMAIAPSLFILPVLWLVYHPPVRLRPLLVGGAIASVVWSPYLSFEVGRGFADLRSQLLLQLIHPSSYRETWCDPGIRLVRWEETATSAASASGRPGLLDRLLARVGRLKEKALSNFQSAVSIPGAGAALAILTLGSLAMSGLSGPFGSRIGPLVVALGVPWLILVLVAEPGKPERFWWLWPLQVAFLAAFVTNVLPGPGVRRAVSWLGQGLLILLLVGNSFLLSRADGWLRTGWAGPDAAEVQVVEYVAAQVRAEGRERAAIGYQMFIYPFMATYNITNPQYKVGAELDLLFKYKAGVTNTNTCAEGTSPDDEYRIVQTAPRPEEWAPRDYFASRLDERFYLLVQFESYQVFKGVGR